MSASYAVAAAKLLPHVHPLPAAALQCMIKGFTAALHHSHCLREPDICQMIGWRVLCSTCALTRLLTPRLKSANAGVTPQRLVAVHGGRMVSVLAYHSLLNQVRCDHSLSVHCAAIPAGWASTTISI